MKAEREVACDERVLRIGRTGAGAAYARTILRLIEALSGGGSTAAVAGGAVGILEGKAQIKRRLVMIARFETTTTTRRRWSAVAAALGLTVGALALSGVTRAADDKPASAPKNDGQHATDAKPAKGGGGGGGGDAHGDERGAGFAVPADPAAGSPAAAKPATPAVGAPAAGAWGPVGGGGIGSGGGDAEDPANARTAEKLKKPIKGVDFNGQGFADVVDFLRDVSGVDILVEWPAMEEAGITRDQPVTLRLREPAPADAVFTLIFRAMGDQAMYQVEHGVVIVSPRNRKMASVTRAYDVSDLVAARGVGEGAPGQGGVGRGGPGGGGGGGAHFVGDNGEVGQLIQLITSTVEPQNWMQAGGSEASVGVFKNKLVIKAPERTHKEVANLLEMLRDRPAPKGEERPK
jgi:hypothetical protein